MADQKVWSNETGQVMLGAGGMILRQPYNFNKALKKAANVTLNVNLRESLNYSSYGFGFWLNNISIPTSPLFTFGGSSFILHHLNYFTGIIQGITEVLQERTNISLISPLWVTFGQNGINVFHSNDSLSVVQETRSFIETGSFSTIVFSASATSTTKIGEFYLFDRALGTDESRYICNVRRGASPLTSQGLKMRLSFGMAEILDFSLNNYVYDPLNVPSISTTRNVPSISSVTPSVLSPLPRSIGGVLRPCTGLLSG